MNVLQFNKVTSQLYKLFKIIQNQRNYTVKVTTTYKVPDKERCNVLIVGGGTGGCSLAAKLCRNLGEGKVTILEPADLHYYQPMFTLIGGGMKRENQSYSTMESVLPKKAKWIKEKAVEFDPKTNTVLTNNEREINYDIMILASGLQLNYDKIPGLLDALSIKNGNVSSIYSPKYVERTWSSFNKFNEGNAIFTFPATAVKCPGAPQKICYIFDDFLNKKKKRNQAKISYNTTLPNIFGVSHYAEALWKVANKRDITVNLRYNLIEVKPDSNIAIFQNLDKPEEKIGVEYSLLHVTPPMSTPKEISSCTELVNAAGFVDVNPKCLQHKKFENIFAIGDCSSSPNSKTAAAVAAQIPIVADAVLTCLKGGKYAGCSYDGYSSCPLVTGYHTCILAEFDYNLQPLETFPMAQNKERYSMFLLKKEMMPFLYWNIMLKGYWNGPQFMRNLLKPLRFG